MKSEWQPNWRDKGQYPAPKTTTPTEWAWEFLRRNQEYQKDYNGWKAHGEEYIAHLCPHITYHVDDGRKKLILSQKKTITGELVISTITTLGFLLEKYHFSELPDLPNPALQAKKQWVIFKGGEITYRRYVSYPEDFPEINLGLTPARPEEIALLLHLDRPIGKQLDKVKKLLKEKRESAEKEKKIKVMKKNNKDESYANYLRVLDAKSNGATSSEIAKILAPKIPNQYPEYYGKEHVDHLYKVAKQLRDQGYYRLIHTPY